MTIYEMTSSISATRGNIRWPHAGVHPSKTGDVQ